jgi:RimJ/RimL family protein N-acetyltransferase
VNPATCNSAANRCRLVPFDRIWAERVVSWVRDGREAYWLAPKSCPPLTPVELQRWHKPDHNPYMLMDGKRREPLGYGELNRIIGPSRQYWLGHLIVDPEFRGRGYGVRLTALLLAEAFEQRGAQRVTLVAFPDNVAAVACYRAAGMVDDGFEWHTFPAYGRRECLMRLAASRGT